MPVSSRKPVQQEVSASAVVVAHLPDNAEIEQIDIGQFKKNPFVKKMLKDKGLDPDGNPPEKNLLDTNPFLAKQKAAMDAASQPKQKQKPTDTENGLFKADSENPFVRASLDRMKEIAERKKKEEKEKRLSDAVKNNPFFKGKV